MTPCHNQVFHYFMKDQSWGKDLYQDLVQPALKVDLSVETWRRSPYLPSFCKPKHKYETLNVLGMNFGT